MATCLPYVGCTTPLDSIITTIMKCTQLTKSRHSIQRYLIYKQSPKIPKTINFK